MNKSRKRWIIILCISLIALIIAICIVVHIMSSQKNETQEIEGDPLFVEYTVEKVRDATKFFSVEKCIQDNIEETFTAEKMNILNAEKIASYAVYGHYIGDGENIEEQYYIVRVDLNNDTFLIEELDEKYNDINQIDLGTDLEQISNSGNNTFEYITISTEQICQIYLENFWELELNDAQKAYNLLDSEYREETFPDSNDFEQYVSENRETIENLTIVDSTTNYTDNYTEYYIQDNDDNTYIIKEDSIMNYVILLDV